MKINKKRLLGYLCVSPVIVATISYIGIIVYGIINYSALRAALCILLVYVTIAGLLYKGLSLLTESNS